MPQGISPNPLNKISEVYLSQISEHHKKDADGNTIPHEGEEINEIAPALAIAAKKVVAGGAKMLAGKAGLKAVAKPTISNVAKAGGEAVKRAAGNPMVQSQAMMSAGQSKEKVNKSSMVSASADLFDIVKGQLLDEGLTEEEIKDIMLTLTPDEILNEISGKLAMQASKVADMKRGELARSGDKAGAADKAAQASRLYKKGAERNIAKQDLSKPLNPQRTDYPMGKGANYQQKPGM